MACGILLVTHPGVGAAILAVATALLRHLPLKAEAFEVEVAEGAQKPLKPDTMYDGVPGTYHPLEIDCTVVWQGRVKGERRLTVDTKNGVFTGPRAGNVGLDDNALHFVRIRESLGGRWSAWSGWHAGFATVWKSGTGERPLPRGYLAR